MDNIDGSTIAVVESDGWEPPVSQFDEHQCFYHNVIH